MGVNVFTGKVINMSKKGVIEPLSVKEQAVKSAVAAASMILRIDDVIAASKQKTAPPSPGGAPGQMPGYGMGY
jgi:chaperonin GroEL (HSP60 family)